MSIVKQFAVAGVVGAAAGVAGLVVTVQLVLPALGY